MATISNPERSRVVNPSDCISHLKFLAALAELRHSITTKDGMNEIFGIKDQDGNAFAADEEHLKLHAEEKVWQIYVSRAVDRFKQWWLSWPCHGKPPTVMSLKRFEMNPLALGEISLIFKDRDDLPPLDVLMVWHSYMLNPRAYLEDCFRQAKMNLWATAFPWELISECINVDDEKQCRYEPGTGARKAWESRTGSHWDNLNDPSWHSLECPSCRHTLRVEWTSARIDMLYPSKDSTQTRNVGFAGAIGYADKSFRGTCYNCKVRLNHEYLAVLRFKDDLEALRKHELPLPGTLFNPDGVVKTSSPNYAKWAQLTPNYLFLNMSQNFVTSLADEGKKCRTVRQLADSIYDYVYRKNVKIEVLDKKSQLADSDMFYSMRGRGRGTLRRMMSRYWGANSSIFALDLVGAVIRQGEFVKKMHILDWIRTYPSSDLSQFMERLVEKYGIFWEIIVSNPSRMAVPTLDIDLVWHTHQLSPRDYYAHSIITTAKNRPVRFIDHNDRVDETVLSDAFEWTVKQYRKASGGKDYSECSCWYCEATRGRGVFEKLSISTLKSKDTNNLQAKEKDQTSTGDVSSHISTHTAVSVEGALRSDSRRRRLNKIIHNHQRHECKQQGLSWKKKNGQLHPSLREALHELPERHEDAYIKIPGCMNVNKDADGNCIGGSCSPSMAAGSCGGSMLKALSPSGQRTHGSGFKYTDRGGGGGGGGACGGGCGGS